MVCVVHPDSGYKTLDDLAKAVKAKPGKLNYSHSGPATVQNLAPQLLLSTLGLKPDAVVSVPYKGGNEVALAVLSRDVDFACNNLSSMTGLLTGGKLRPLLTTTPERLAQFPDIPTARELGLPQMEAVIGWSGLFGPPKMAPEAVRRWAAALKQIARDPKWIAGMKILAGSRMCCRRRIPNGMCGTGRDLCGAGGEGGVAGELAARVDARASGAAVSRRTPCPG